MSLMTPNAPAGAPAPRASGSLIKSEMEKSVVQARQKSRQSRISVLVSQVAILVIFLGAWQWAADSGFLKNANLFYGSPSGVYQMLIDNREHLFESLMATITAAFIGFAIGVVAAVIVGVLLSQVAFINRVVDPYIVVLTGMPRIALAPLFVLWFGIGDTAKIALSVSLVFFIVLINVLAGFKSVDEDLIVMATSFGAKEGNLVTKIALPSAVPVLFAGLRLGLVFSILGVIASEMTAAKNGLGLDVIIYAQTMRPNGIFAVLLILAAAMALLNWVLSLIEKRLLRWVPARHS